jgi:hypothetical protein
LTFPISPPFCHVTADLFRFWCPLLKGIIFVNYMTTSYRCRAILKGKCRFTCIMRKLANIPSLFLWSSDIHSSYCKSVLTSEQIAKRRLRECHRLRLHNDSLPNKCVYIDSREKRLPQERSNSYKSLRRSSRTLDNDELMITLCDYFREIDAPVVLLAAWREHSRPPASPPSSRFAFLFKNIFVFIIFIFLFIFYKLHLPVFIIKDWLITVVD